MTILSCKTHLYDTILRLQIYKTYMKRIFSALLFSAFFCTTNAQLVANDSVEIGQDNKLTTFYSLSTGQKTNASYNDWHLAITVRPTQYPGSTLGGTTIRINEAFGVKVYYVPNANAAAFSTVDTTGYKQWTLLHDSDTAIDDGALNSNRNLANQFDFGWGLYSGSNHNVTGDSLYLIELPTGELKKFLVVNLDKDTAFNLKYSDIDNSNLQTLHISKKEYLGKEFVYVNLADNYVSNKEPFAPDWDLQFLKYTATDILSNRHIPIVGVWLNKGTAATKREHHDVLDNDMSGLNFSTKLNAIGWAWKKPGSLFALLSGKTLFENLEFYQIEDSLAYFVQTKGGEFYKLVFTRYNTNNGRIVFHKEKLFAATGVEETEIESAINLFPNPANSVLNIVLPSSPAVLKVMDMTGRLITETTATENIIQLNTGEFATGVYLLQTTINGKASVKKFMVNR